MSVKVRSVLGDISPDELQAVLPHEHALLQHGKSLSQEEYIQQALPALSRRMRREFRRLIARGCNGFVDCNPAGYIRLPEQLRALSQATGMHVVTATGFYVEESLPRWVKQASVAELAEFLMRDISKGTEGTAARAGALKVSSNNYRLEPTEEKVFLAAADVHRKTGVPLTTHSPRGARAHVQFFEDQGIDPSRVALGHIEVNPWQDILEVARKGAMLLFTNFGGKEVVPEDMIIAQIADLVRRGYVRQVMISVDMYMYYENHRLRQRWPGGYVQIFDRVIPRLKKAGLKARDIDLIMRDNPCRHLAF